MALSASYVTESEAITHQAYSRKDRSLGLLCSNFLSLYNREGVELVGLDDAATQLGVERRRIYDIVNVLESVGVLSRKAKNQYSWNGFEAIPKALEQLKEGGFTESLNTQDGSVCFKGLDEFDDDSFSNTSSQHDKSECISHPKSCASSKFDSRREKSLGLLTQNFIKLFLCSDMDLISLDDAARLLLGDAHNLSTMRTKVRRLYDIANVLSSMNLIEKTHQKDTKKPGFRWLGLTGKLGRGRVDYSEHTVGTKKRMFGVDITNTGIKKARGNALMDANNPKVNHKSQLQIQTAAENDMVVGGTDEASFDRDSKHASKMFEFGPFSPATVPRVCTSPTNNVTRVHDWALSNTFRPRYHNQALKDLFVHYKEAWESWYLEVSGEKHVRQVS